MAAGCICWLFKKGHRGALVVGLGVLSHWFFYLLVHVPDLQLTPFGDYKVGLGLWNHRTLTLILELFIFIAWVYLYARVTKAKNGIGRWVFWILVALLPVIHLSNAFGPTPTASPTTSCCLNNSNGDIGLPGLPG